MSTVETPAAIESTVSNRNDDRWFEYDGEPLWEDEMVELLEETFEQMESTDWENVASLNGSMDRTKIHTDHTEEFIEAFEQQFSKVDSEWTFLTKKYKPEVTEKGPVRSDVSIRYEVGGKVALGGERYKRNKIIRKVRDFENWLFKTKVVEPVFEEYNEKYPY